MADINKLSVLEAFTEFKEFSWKDFMKTFPKVEQVRFSAQRLWIIIKQLEDEQLIQPVKGKDLTWTVTSAAFEQYRLLSKEYNCY